MHYAEFESQERIEKFFDRQIDCLFLINSIISLAGSSTINITATSPNTNATLFLCIRCVHYLIVSQYPNRLINLTKFYDNIPTMFPYCLVNTILLILHANLIPEYINRNRFALLSLI